MENIVLYRPYWYTLGISAAGVCSVLNLKVLQQDWHFPLNCARHYRNASWYLTTLKILQCILLWRAQLLSWNRWCFWRSLGSVTNLWGKLAFSWKERLYLCTADFNSFKEGEAGTLRSGILQWVLYGRHSLVNLSWLGGHLCVSL